MCELLFNYSMRAVPAEQCCCCFLLVQRGVFPDDFTAQDILALVVHIQELYDGVSYAGQPPHIRFIFRFERASDIFLLTLLNSQHHNILKFPHISSRWQCLNYKVDLISEREILV